MRNAFLAYFLFLPFLLVGQTKESDILGIWLNEKKEAVVEIYKIGNEYFGKIIDIQGEHAHRKSALKDTNNPKPELKSRPLIGLTLLENLKYANGEYGGGTAYNPRMGRYFVCKVWLISKNTMKVRGYLGPVFGTETWERR